MDHPTLDAIVLVASMALIAFTAWLRSRKDS